MLTDGYALGLDGGSSRLIAAVATPSPEKGVVVTPCRLGADRTDVPAAAYVTDGGDVLFGEAAEEQGSERPERLLHDFVRDVGDSTPLIAGDFAVRADELYARLMGWAVMAVTAAQGAPPETVAIAHPNSWRGHRIEAVRTRLREMGLDDVLLLPAAAAAAQQQYAAGGLPPRGTVAVYDFGGSGFCGAVLRAQGGGDYRLTGAPVLLDDVSGRAFDHRVMRHALAMAERAMTPASSPADSPVHSAALPVAALSAARHAATKAKEALSFGPETTIELEFDDGRGSVRLTRDEFESVIGADLNRTADALDRALEIAGVDADQVDAIVLAGGSSRIPAVVEHLSARFDLPVCASDPHVAAVFGAARAAWSVHEAQSSTTREPAVEEGAVPAPAPRPRRAVRLRPAISGAVMLSVGTLLIAGAAFATVLPDGRQDDAVGESFRDGAPAAGKGLDLPLAWTPGVAAVDGPGAGPVPQPVNQLGPVLPVDDGAPRTQSDSPSSPSRSSLTPVGTNAGSPAETHAAPASATTTAPATGGPVTAPSGGTTPTPPPDPAPSADPTPDPAPSADPTPDPAPSADPTPDPAPSADPTPDPAPSADPTQTPTEPPAPSPDLAPAPDPSPSPSGDPAPLATSEPAPPATP